MKRRGNLGLSDEVEVRRIASKIEGVREWFKGDEADRRAAINRSKVVEGRNRNNVDRLSNSLGETEVQTYGIIAEIRRL